MRDEKGVIDMRTYLLIHTEPGRAGEVARAIESDPRVLSAATVSGAYDVVAQVTVGGSNDISELSARLRTLPGVSRVVACPVRVHETLWDDTMAPALAGR